MSEQFDLSTANADSQVVIVCRNCGAVATTPFGPQARAWTLNHTCPKETP